MGKRAAKTKAGRPSLSGTGAASVQIKTRVPTELLDRICTAVERERTTLSEWLRDAAEHKLARSMK